MAALTREHSGQPGQPPLLARCLTLLQRTYRARTAYLFLLPGLVLFGIFVIYPMLYSLRISFYDWNVIKPVKSEWVGMDNYRTLLVSPVLHRAVLNTLAYTVTTVPGQMILALVVAILLDQEIRGKTLFRVAYYLPVITSWVIATLVFEYLFNSQAGLINYLLRDVLRLVQEPVRWLADPILAMVPIHLLDIILPLLRPTLVFLLVVLVIGALNVYIPILLMTNGGQPLDLTHSALTLMYKETFDRLNFGGGAATSYLLTSFVFVVSIIQIRLLRQRMEY
jgi:multiple sugar transport system permease protein